MTEQDFLVFYEDEDDGSDDALVVDIHSVQKRLQAELDLEADIEVGLENRSARSGAVGLWLTVAGSVLGIVGLALFLLNYPDSWYDGTVAARTTVQVAAMALGVVSFLLMVPGVLLTIFGRRILVSGRLQEIHVVEKNLHGFDTE